MQKVLLFAGLGFVLLFSGGWGGFDDIDTSRYFDAGNSATNVHRNARGDAVMIVKDETTNLHDQVQNAMTQWAGVGCDYDLSCPGVEIKYYVPGGHAPDVVVSDSCCSGTNWEDAGVIKLSPTMSGPYSYEITLHEFGHALGFRHFPNSYQCRTAMIVTLTCRDATGASTPMISPGDIDRSLYYHRWIKGDWDSRGVIVNPDSARLKGRSFGETPAF